jgi:lipopolysaccharide heptosyltransferase II
VIIEAQAAGVPVVATQVGGVVDIIEDNKTGLLVAPSDPSGMAEAIIKIAKEPELARKLAENAYKKVKEKYNVELMVERTVGVYKEALENFKILIIKFGSLGDVILSTAAILAIRNKFLHKYKISLLVSQECKDALLACPYIDELLVSDLKNKDRGIRGVLKLAALLRRKKFDIVIDLQNNRKSHLIARLTLALDRYGYGNKKLGFLLNHRIKDEKPLIDPVTHQFRILKMLDINLESSHLELWPRPEDQGYIDEFLNSQWVSANQKLVGINISASSRWLTKNWPLSHINKLCEELSRRDIRVVITGLNKDLSAADTLINSVKYAKIINACARTTVNQLACLIKRCSVYITPDSAPLHIAAALNTPFIALFGPTDSRRHIPPAKDYIVIKKELPCSPCYKSKCKTKRCMEQIRPEEVLGAVEKILKI